MFSLDQIKEAHSKVKSGADFPEYIRDLKKLGLTHYEIFVQDGCANYYGTSNYKVTSPAKYDVLIINGELNKEQFMIDLKAHQNGKTDYLTFCNDAAISGIEKWIVSIDEMTCTYYDKMRNNVLTETIPG